MALSARCAQFSAFSRKISDCFMMSPFSKKTYAGSARLQRSSNEGSVTVDRATLCHKAASGCSIHRSFIEASGASTHKSKRPDLSIRPFKIHQTVIEISARLRDRRGSLLLLDLALELKRARRKARGAGLQQEGIEAAIVIDALDRVGRHAQTHVAAQRIRDEGHVAQVRQNAPLGLEIRVAHLVTHQRALGRQFTAPRHLEKSSSIPASALIRWVS